MNFPIKPLLIALTFAGLKVSSVNAAIAQLDVQQLVNGHHVDVASIDQLYLQAVNSATGVEQVQRQLQQIASASTDASRRANSQLLAGALAWKQGQTQAALTSLTQAATTANDAQHYAWLARIEEASGDVKAATHHYQQQLALIQDPQEKQRILLRLALLSDNRQQLQAFAKQFPQYQRQIAEVLALLGEPASALTLTAHTKRTQAVDLTLMADWALTAKQYPQAANYAWQAYQAAKQDSDKRYAMALYVEAWRLDGKLAKAADFLQPHANDAITQVLYVNLLLELGQYDAALNFVESSSLPELKAREAALIELANRPEQLRDFYRRQIKLQPNDVAAYNGLASELINQGQLQQARAVYSDFARSNRGNLKVLLQAAQQMIAMGLSDDALAMMRNATSADKANTQVQLFLFDTYLNSGNETAAAKVLAELEQHIAANSNVRLTLAESYERLRNPERALTILRQFMANGGRLGYDQQLHVASLADSIGQHQQALDLWYRLWTETTLPARKNFLENLIVNGARKLNTFAQLIEQLQQKLQQNAANQNDVNLLVALSIANNQPQQAVNAVQQYAQLAGMTDVERLKQLASIYGRLEAYDKLNDVWRQLATLEPNNAKQYWQQITLNSLRNNIFDAEKPRKGQSAEELRLEQVQRLLHNLQENGESIDHEFAAELYAMAGLPKQAAQEYQSAYANNPQNGDSLLQLVQILKQQQQTSQATSMLQYQLEFASTSNAFFTAVDGLLNLFSSGEQGMSGNERVQGKQVLRWLKQRVIERLVFDQDPTRTLLTLSDVTQTLSEFDSVEQANRILLAVNEIQRPAILRSLVSQYNGASGDGTSSGPAIGDLQKKLIYGRRLLALQQEFPPSLYNDLAEALLADKDILGAERAFSMMTDIPGIVNVKQQKGNAFARAGYDNRALTYYRQALVTDQSNYELLLKTSVLEEQMQKADIAFHWYWLGVNRLIEQQPLFDKAPQNARISDLNKYFPSLSEGLLITAQTAPKHAEQATKNLQQLFNQTLKLSGKTLAEGQPASLNNYPRLQLIQSLLRQLAAATNNLQLAHWVDAQLSPRFMHDQQYVAQTARYWQLQTGAAAPVVGDDQHWPMHALAAQAASDDNFPLQLRLALQQGNWEQVAQLATKVVAALKDPQPSENSMMLKNQYYPLIEMAAQEVPTNVFSEKIWPILMNVADPELVCFQLQRFQPTLFATISAKIPSPLLTPQQFVALALQHSNDFAPSGMQHFSNDEAYRTLLMQQLSIDEQLQLYDNLVQDFQRNNRYSDLTRQLLRGLLQQHLSMAQQQRLQTLFLANVTFSPNGKATPASIIEQMLLLNVAPTNQQLLIDTAEKLVLQRPDVAGLEHFLTQYYAGDKAAAFISLLQLHQQASGRNDYNFLRYIPPQVFAAERQAYIRDFLSKNQATDGEIKLFYEEITSSEDDNSSLAQQLQQLRKLRPDDPLFLAAWLRLQWRKQDYAEFVRSLSQWNSQFPDKDNLHLLYFVRRLSDPFSTNNQGEINDIDTLVSWLNKAMSPTTSRASLMSLYPEVFDKYAEKNSQLDVIQQFKQRRASQQMVSPHSETPLGLTKLAQLYKQDRAQGIALLGTIWRNALPGSQQFDGHNLSREQLLYTRYDSDGNVVDTRTQPVYQPLLDNGEDLLAEIAANPAGSAMFEKWLLALSDAERPNQQRLYQLIVSGWQQQQQLNAQQLKLLSQLEAGEMTLTQLQLLLTSLDASHATLTTAQLDKLTALAKRLPLLSVHTRLQMAHVFASAARYDDASGLVRAATWQLNYPAPTIENRIESSRPNAPKLQDIVLELSHWSDKAAAGQLLQQVLQLSLQTITLNKDSESLWHSFVLMAAAQVQLAKADSTELTNALKIVDHDSSNYLNLAAAQYFYQQQRDGDWQTYLWAALKQKAEPKAGEWIPYNRELELLSTRLFGFGVSATTEQQLVPSMIDFVQTLDVASLQEVATHLLSMTPTQINALSSDHLTGLTLVLAKQLIAHNDVAIARQLLTQVAAALPAATDAQQALSQAQAQWLK
ncbi:hypothetical protein [Shewanella sp.]|uniref:hypothetical protein n=1 Tax=Shewanella sp. TaxID=50422 RepID=UPI003A9849B0